MSEDIRWQQRFENLGKALDRFREALNGTTEEPSNHLYSDLLKKHS